MPSLDAPRAEDDEESLVAEERKGFSGWLRRYLRLRPLVKIGLRPKSRLIGLGDRGLRTMKRLRIYADTSVIGGCLDAEFADDSLRLIEAVRKGRFVLLLSDIVIRELEDAPEQVRAILP